MALGGTSQAHPPPIPMTSSILSRVGSAKAMLQTDLSQSLRTAELGR